MKRIEGRIVSSLEKIFLQDDIGKFKILSEFSMLRNERYCFQLAFHADDLSLPWRKKLKVRIESPLKDFCTVGLVENVPSRLPVHFTREDDDYLTKEIGLYPDPVFPLSSDSFYIHPRQSQSLWIDIRLDGTVKGGKYPVSVIVSDEKDNVLIEETVSAEVIPASLPRNDRVIIQWFHADCLADYYRVKIFSEEHWEIIANYIETAVANGINCIYVPLFTPPLDTYVGGERPTTQLVGIEKNGDNYTFDFTKLKRWIDLCKKLGIQYYEMCQLFTQWGAEHAPKIMAKVGGEEVRIFGWETDASGDEYRGFLQVFLKKLLEFLKKEDIDQQCFFHISDEPGEKKLQNYVKASEIIRPILKGYPIIDAVAHTEYYERGLLDIPVASIMKITKFLEKGISAAWVYYCSSHHRDVPNRYFAMPAYRNRIMGIQLYKHKLQGFLHWGYNFYNSALSIRKINPFMTTDADGRYPSGDCFSVYPADDGTAIESTRIAVFHQALQDMSALELGEKLYGREKMLQLFEGDLEEPITLYEYPRNSEYILNFRERLNRLIAGKTAPERE